MPEGVKKLHLGFTLHHYREVNDDRQHTGEFIACIHALDLHCMPQMRTGGTRRCSVGCSGCSLVARGVDAADAALFIAQ